MCDCVLATIWVVAIIDFVRLWVAIALYVYTRVDCRMFPTLLLWPLVAGLQVPPAAAATDGTSFLTTSTTHAAQMFGHQDTMGGGQHNLSHKCYALMHDRVALQQKDEVLDRQLTTACGGDRYTLCPEHEWVGIWMWTGVWLLVWECIS